jgi:hypothetical protein
MNFQAYLEDTYRIIKEEPLILILGGLLVQLLTVFSLGILAGPLLGGYTLLVILYLRENRKPTFNDIFSGLQQFAILFPYFLVLLLIIFGFMLLILPGLLFVTWWLYVLPLMVDRNMSFSNAMRLSKNKVNEKGFLMHFVFVLLVYVIPLMLIEFFTAIIPFAQLLKILLPAFQVGCLASLYIDQFPGPAAGPEVTITAPPGTTQSAGDAKHSDSGTEKQSSEAEQLVAEEETTFQDETETAPEEFGETGTKEADKD